LNEKLLQGNEAIARAPGRRVWWWGAPIPGTPSSEIRAELSSTRKSTRNGLPREVAVEVPTGASLPVEGHWPA